ncbi:MAG: response regulator [Myxococcota bacterium]|nr:response regulator [Myxococcota bacterium]
MDTVARPFVLIAEDDAQAARVLARMLREDGYDVEVVLDGAAAISRLSQGRMPDALVVDYRLPHADGLAVARYARMLSARVCVVLVTSYFEVIEPLIQDESSLKVLSKPLVYAELVRHLPPL